MHALPHACMQVDGGRGCKWVRVRLDIRKLLVFFEKKKWPETCRFLLFVVFEGEAANKPGKSCFFILFLLGLSSTQGGAYTKRQSATPPRTIQPDQAHFSKNFTKALSALRDQAYGRFGLAQTSGLFFCFHIGSSGLQKRMLFKPAVRKCCHPPA